MLGMGGRKFGLAFQSTYAIGLLIWPIMIAFIAMICLQTKLDTQLMVIECVFAPPAVLFVVGFVLTLVQTPFMSMFIGE
jgi:hypothetical protein